MHFGRAVNLGGEETMINMKHILILAVLALSSLAPASNPPGHSVRSYVRRNGTYVAPSHATNPNRTQRDNYSARGNTNPYTGKTGTKTPKR